MRAVYLVEWAFSYYIMDTEEDIEKAATKLMKDT